MTFLRFRWVKDGVEFDPPSFSATLVSLDSGSFSAKDGPIHQFQGNYSCLASNELGTAVSKEAQIITEGASHVLIAYVYDKLLPIKA